MMETITIQEKFTEIYYKQDGTHPQKFTKSVDLFEKETGLKAPYKNATSFKVRLGQKHKKMT